MAYHPESDNRHNYAQAAAQQAHGNAISGTMAPVPSSPFAAVFSAASEVNALASALEALAVRLVGPYPALSGATTPDSKPDSLFAEVNTATSGMFRACGRGQEALDRITQFLP